MSQAATATSSKDPLTAWWAGLAGLALAVGAGFACGHFDLIGQLSLQSGRDWLVRTTAQAWQLFGIAFIGLVPLGGWLLVLIWKHLIRRQSAGNAVQLDLAFISRNGPLLGLLGTVVALASAGATLAVEVESGAASAVLGIIPLVGQALLSTIAGIILAVGADAILHCIERGELNETV